MLLPSRSQWKSAQLLSPCRMFGSRWMPWTFGLPEWKLCWPLWRYVWIECQLRGKSESLRKHQEDLSITVSVSGEKSCGCLQLPRWIPRRSIQLLYPLRSGYDMFVQLLCEYEYDWLTIRITANYIISQFDPTEYGQMCLTKPIQRQYVNSSHLFLFFLSADLEFK